MRKKCLLMISVGIALATANAPTAVAQEVAGVEISSATTLPITRVTEATDDNYNFKNFEVEAYTAGSVNANESCANIPVSTLNITQPGVYVISVVTRNGVISKKVAIK